MLVIIFIKDCGFSERKVFRTPETRNMYKIQETDVSVGGWRYFVAAVAILYVNVSADVIGVLILIV